MASAGLDPQTVVHALSVVAATLHIGNISFSENAEDGFASVSDEECCHSPLPPYCFFVFINILTDLQFPAFLLGLSPAAIKVLG